MKLDVVLFGRRTEQLVGLDIGSSAVKAVELRQTGDQYTVVALGVEPVPPDSIVDGAILDSGIVSDVIRRLFSRLGIKTKKVAVSVAGNAVIVKKITLPVMGEAELGDSIHWEAKQHIPFDIEDVNLDYQVLETAPDAGDQGTQDVLLVAAKKDKIADYTGVVAQAGCVPVVVDIDGFALQNAYELNYGIQPDGVVALINAGASAININVLHGDRSIFTRDLATGGNAYTEALQRELNLGFDEADLLKKGVPIDDVTHEDAEPVIRTVSENLLMEISKTVDFFRTTASSDRVDRIVLSGGSSRVEGFAEALAERFDIRVDRFDPFRHVLLDPAKVSGDQQMDIAPIAAVAVGLTLRRADDR